MASAEAGYQQNKKTQQGAHQHPIPAVIDGSGVICEANEQSSQRESDHLNQESIMIQQETWNEYTCGDAKSCIQVLTADEFSKLQLIIHAEAKIKRIL